LSKKNFGGKKINFADKFSDLGKTILRAKKKKQRITPRIFMLLIDFFWGDPKLALRPIL
jgi:hypothetical protein